MRDNFKGWQKQAALAASALDVRNQWREFRELPDTYYICSHCRFVSSVIADFEVDHIVSCQYGGSANREPAERIAAITAELEKPVNRMNMDLILSANANDQVLCHGCNQGKKSTGRAPDLIPEGCGFAYRRHSADKNPDHIYSGPPRTVGFVERRYRNTP